MLESGVQAFRILAHDDQVYVGIASGNVGQITNGSKIGVEFEFLPQRDVDAGETAANRCGDRTFERDVGSFDRFDYFFRNVFFIFFKRVCPDHESFPFELHAGGFEDANSGLRHFWADAVAGDKGDLVCHKKRARL